MHNVPPPWLFLPAGHSEHEVAPVTFEKVPRGQFTHVVKLEYLPKPHSEHEEEPATPEVLKPGAQVVQAVAPELENLPASHSTHK